MRMCENSSGHVFRAYFNFALVFVINVLELINSRGIGLVYVVCASRLYPMLLQYAEKGEYISK